jgi:hypothetical protein
MKGLDPCLEAVTRTGGLEEQLWLSTAGPLLVERDRKIQWKDQPELGRPSVRLSLCTSAWQHRFERRHHCQVHLTV